MWVLLLRAFFSASSSLEQLLDLVARCFLPSVADEEPVDPKKYLEERCKPQCVKPLYEYEKCVKRVEKDDTGHKHCTGQYFDYWSCIDKCVAPKLLEKLK
uniref:Complex III subunit VI n=1 Tax=Oryza meridionalis TaxID=40149 RepID=A0A0E0F2V4_9ORYZ